MEATEAIRAALVEVDGALRTLLLSGGRQERDGDRQAAAHRFLQAFQRQHPLGWPCAMMGLGAALDDHTATPSNPLPLFLAQTLALKARKSWGAGGLGAAELGAVGQLFLRYCASIDPQVGTQLGLALCAGVIACPRVAPPMVFAEAAGLLDRAAAAGGGLRSVEAAWVRLLQLLPEEALRSRSLSLPMDRRRAVLRALAVGDETTASSASPSPPAAQALHHLVSLVPGPTPGAFAAMGAWLELDWLPWDTVVGPWLPRALELAHAAVGRWAVVGGGGEEDEAEAAAAAVLELLAGVVAPSLEGGEDAGPPVGGAGRGGGRAAAEEEAEGLRRHRRRQGIEAGAAILPLLPHVWAAVTSQAPHHGNCSNDGVTSSRRDSSVGRAALSLIVAVGMAGLEEAEAATSVEDGPPPLYRDPGPIMTPLLAAVAEGSLPTAALAFPFWQALGDAPPPPHYHAAAIDAAVLHFVAALVRRSTFPPGYPVTVSLEDRQAFEEFREEAREALRGVVGGGARGPAVAAALIQELWRVQQQSSQATSEQALLFLFPLESIVHALSALGKDLPRLLPTHDLARLVTALPTLPPHPAIARSAGLLLSTLPDWLTGPTSNESALHAALQVLLASLTYPESDREPFPLRSKQDHAGVIALLKLAQAGPARLAAIPEAAEQLTAAYHALRHPTSSTSPPLEPRSQLLLLDAAVRVAVHLPSEAAAAAQLETLCGPMWAGVAGALSAAASQDEGDGVVKEQLGALATVVQAANGAGGGGVGALVACFLARGEGIRGLLAHDAHGREGWALGAVALTASLLRALGRAIAAGPSSVAAMLEAYHRCLQGWGLTLLHQLPSAPTSTTSTNTLVLLPAFLEWTEAALHPLLTHHHGPYDASSSALIPAAWNIHIKVTRCCGGVLLALQQQGKGTVAGRGGESEARETLAAAFFGAFTRLPLPPPSPLSQQDPGLLPLALQTAAACLDMQSREAGKAVCGFIRHAAAAAACGDGGNLLHGLFLHAVEQPDGRADAQPQPRAMWLMLGLLSGVCGAMPSWMLDDLIAALASLFQAFGAEAAGGWMAAAIAHPAFPRAHLSEQARAQFLGQIARCVLPPSAGLSDPQQLRAFKTSIKAYCGGKKKGSSGTPQQSKPK